jgi:hypothetical protein
MPAFITTLVLVSVGVSASLALIINFRSFFKLPAPEDPAAGPTRWDALLGATLHTLAYLLAGPRLVFAVLPWLTKRAFFLMLGKRAYTVWHSSWFQVLRLLCETANLWLTVWLIGQLRTESRLVLSVLGIATCAECTRLVAQRGQMVWSALWQYVPHGALARRLLGIAPHARGQLARYYHYYALSDQERLAYIVAVVRARTVCDPQGWRRMRHLRGFRMVPTRHPLRSGHVRDVARGEVFVHRRWTNDPWLLVGQALRRTPWMFDPRELPRPFTYRGAANRAATSFVLSRARYTPVYAWYQFGHEIKAAGHDLVFSTLRILGCECEPPVDAHGIFPFEDAQPARSERALMSDAQVLAELRDRHQATCACDALQIAIHYTYPYLYVEEVLLKQLAGLARCEPSRSNCKRCGQGGRRPHADLQLPLSASTTNEAVRSGASQCG